MTDVRAEIEELAAFDERGPGTDAERRAARHLEERLRSLGREAETEPIGVYPNYPMAHAIHAVVAIVGSVLSVTAPAAGAVLVLLATFSTFGDMSGSFHLVRRLTGRRASQNVTSVEGGDKPGVVILTARYDAPRAGAAFSRRWPIAPFALFFWSMSLILVCALVRLAGVEGVPLTVVQFIPTVVLIASVPLFGDIALSRFAHEANGPGVGAVLRLAESHGGKLDHFDVWVVLTGADTALMLGTREWVRARKRELDPERTVFVNVQADGGGALRWAKKEGLVMRLRYHPTLVEICEEIGEGRGITSREATGALAARSAGFPAITIAAGAETADEAYDFCAALLERLDESIGPELA